MTPDKREAKYKAIEEEAKGALSGADGRVAALAYFAANSSLYGTATPAQKKALIPDRIQALTSVLQGSESPSLRLELVDLYLGTGDTTKAVDQIKSAALALTGTSVEDQKNYESILAKLDKMTSAKQITDADAKTVQSTLDHWLTTMHQEDEMKAQTEKQEADLRKQNEAIMKKQAADAAAAAAKAKTAAKSATPAPSTTATSTNTVHVPPATTGK